MNMRPRCHFLMLTVSVLNRHAIDQKHEETSAPPRISVLCYDLSRSASCPSWLSGLVFVSLEFIFIIPNWFLHDKIST
ncbi:hypothetical protein CY34DRAFT_218785 [Suillus luteus UH-Slu-Lm8-n1]|uniref:Uncharacterized protein n=1 Tax=Suillus luteus UH-Slu-Lm8-n1 TaxID=930992 RepID=A0A0D0AHB7_9AGAM|nr:hypothetical protein CY34DRAFT_218785 [Suillus luteus UH-Slu-Lm8-n1]